MEDVDKKTRIRDEYKGLYKRYLKTHTNLKRSIFFYVNDESYLFLMQKNIFGKKEKRKHIRSMHSCLLY